MSVNAEDDIDAARTGVFPRSAADCLKFTKVR